MRSGNGVLAWATVMVAGSWLITTPAAADNKGKAKVMINQVRGVLSDDNCFQSTGCGDRATLPAAVTKCEQALALDPTPETAFTVCDLLKDVRGPDLKWAVESGALHVALSHCDYAAFHPKSSEELRRSALDAGHMARRFIAEVRTKAENDARRAAAAKALYGVGLTMKYDKKKNQISLDYGSLDAKTLQSYIAEYYGEFAHGDGRTDPLPINFVEGDKKAAYLAALETGGTGWILLDPTAKASMCSAIAYSMDQGGREVEKWCSVQEAIEANSPLFAFTGTPVTYDAGNLQGGGLSPGQRIFLPTPDGQYPVAITVAGPNPIDDYEHIRFLLGFGSQASDPEVLGLVARAEKIDKAHQAERAKADAKLGGTKGKVVFTEATFDSWELPKVLTGPAADCDNFYFKVYAPKGDKSYDAELAVDGQICQVFPLWSNTLSTSNSGPVKAQCPKVVSIPGEHTVKVSVHMLKTTKTGNRVITPSGDGWTVEDEYMSAWGKKVGTWTAQCTTAGKAATSRFE